MWSVMRNSQVLRAVFGASTGMLFFLSAVAFSSPAMAVDCLTTPEDPSCSASPTPDPSSSSSPSPTPEPTSSPTASPEPSPSATSSPTPTPEPSPASTVALTDDQYTGLVAVGSVLVLLSVASLVMAGASVWRLYE